MYKPWSSHMFNLEVKNPTLTQMMFHVWRQQRGIVRHLRIEQTSLLKQLSWYKFMEILLLCFSNYIYLCFYYLISLSILKNINCTCSRFLILHRKTHSLLRPSYTFLSVGLIYCFPPSTIYPVDCASRCEPPYMFKAV